MWFIFHHHSFFRFSENVKYCDATVNISLCRDKNCNKLEIKSTLDRNLRRHSYITADQVKVLDYPSFHTSDVSSDVEEVKKKLSLKKSEFFHAGLKEIKNLNKLKRLVKHAKKQDDYHFCDNCGVKQ